MINLDECLEQGLLRKIVPSKEKAFACADKAKKLLEEAKFHLDNEKTNSVIIIGYTALFDAARAILFNDGYRERSHACVTRYLEVKYPKEITRDTILLLDRYRVCRHNTQYDVTYFPSLEEAKNLVDFAEKFLKIIQNIIGYKEIERPQ